MFRGIFFSNDPGGTNALIPIVAELSNDRNFELHNFASFHAISLWQQSGLPFITLPAGLGYDDIANLVRQASPDFIFTDTGEDPTVQHRFWQAGRQQNIFTFSIIDHWTRYRDRYTIEDVFQPTDRIFVIDQRSKLEMEALGFESDKIIPSGQPHFEKFVGYQSNLSRTEFLERNGLPDRKIILFVSDIVSKAFGSDHLGRPSLGYDEQSVLSAVVDQLEQVKMPDRFQLVVKLHPKEQEGSFFTLLQQRKSSTPVRTLKESQNLDLIFHSSYVIGMFSMMLFEAFLMGKPVLSVQLNAVNPIIIADNRIPLVIKPEDLKDSMTRFFACPTIQRPVAQKDAVQTICRTIPEFLKR